MSITVKIRRGEGWFWSRVKAVARAVLSMHVPVGRVTLPLFRSLYATHIMVRYGMQWFARFFWCEPIFRSQCAEIGTGFMMEKLPFLMGHGQLIIKSRVHLSGKPSIFFCNSVEDKPTLTIGDGTFVGHNVLLAAALRIEIGRHCLIAPDVSIRDYDGHPVDAALRRERAPITADDIRPVRIGDDVWLGFRVQVMKGVTVGNRSIVAANSVVTKDVPPDCVVAGNPARIVKRLTEEMPQATECCH